MKQIERTWLQNHSSCPDPSNSFSSNSLGLDSFWGLFLIAGVASISALLIFAITFLYEHRHDWLSNINPNASTWARIGVLLSIFDQRDLSSHTFKKGEHKDQSNTTHHHGLGHAGEASPSAQPSPSSCTESNFSFYGDQGTPSEDNVELDWHSQASQLPLSSLSHPQEL